MRIYPAVHYTMGGLWVDYNLMSNVPGLYVLGEANFSDHGANRLGASALMQGLADGYFVLPATIGDYLAPLLGKPPVVDRRPGVPPRPRRTSPTRRNRLLVGQRHALGRPLPPRARQDHVGQLRHGPQRARAWRRRSPRSPRCARSSGTTCACSARTRRFNQSLEKAGRVADFLEFGELLVPRRAAPRGELRRALPRRAPDRGGRGAARRRATSRYVGRVGVHGRRRRARAAQGAARVRERPPRPAELQVDGRRGRRGSDAQGLAPGRPRRRRCASRPTTMPDVSADMSFLEMFDVLNERLDRARARSRSRSTTTAARASAARAR